jgi:hypothetical protein
VSGPARFVAPLLFAVLVGATVAILVLSQGARTSLVVDQIELSNDFNPAKGERAAVRFRLTQDEESATVEVIDADDETVAVLVEDEPLGDFEIHRYTWDGEDAEPGDHRIRLTLEGLDRELVLPEVIDVRSGPRG